MYMVQYQIPTANGLRLTVKCNWQWDCIHRAQTSNCMCIHRPRSPLWCNSLVFLLLFVILVAVQMPEICLHISVLCRWHNNKQLSKCATLVFCNRCAQVEYAELQLCPFVHHSDGLHCWSATTRRAADIECTICFLYGHRVDEGVGGVSIGHGRHGMAQQQICK